MPAPRGMMRQPPLLLTVAGGLWGVLGKLGARARSEGGGASDLMIPGHVPRQTQSGPDTLLCPQHPRPGSGASGKNPTGSRAQKGTDTWKAINLYLRKAKHQLLCGHREDPLCFGGSAAWGVAAVSGVREEAGGREAGWVGVGGARVPRALPRRHSRWTVAHDSDAFCPRLPVFQMVP